MQSKQFIFLLVTSQAGIPSQKFTLTIYLLTNCNSTPNLSITTLNIFREKGFLFNLNYLRRISALADSIPVVVIGPAFVRQLRVGQKET